MVRCFFFCFKQKTAYEMRISDWSSDVCSSDLLADAQDQPPLVGQSHRALPSAIALQFLVVERLHGTERALVDRRPDELHPLTEGLDDGRVQIGRESRVRLEPP